MSALHAIILAGGKSSRMKRNKSFVMLNNQPLIEIIINRLKPVFNDNITIITNEPELYQYLNVNIQSDLIKNKGPLGGIYTGLIVSDFMYNFFLPCDTPFINMEVIEYMIKEKEGYDVIVPVIRGYIEPLYGIYSKSCIKSIHKCLLEDKLRAKSFFNQIKVKTIPESIFKAIDPQLKMFTNINTPEHLEIAQKMM